MIDMEGTGKVKKEELKTLLREIDFFVSLMVHVRGLQARDRNSDAGNEPSEDKERSRWKSGRGRVKGEGRCEQRRRWWDDIVLVRNIHKRFVNLTEVEEPLILNPLLMLPPLGLDSDDGDDDDFETLRAIKLRFITYDDC
ncbi:unnamed protein product [Fraxinus pennsylvanica]|uniref:EF-hand domain-containing protein n=1 Tax=Fraxinus pennsylvanica TaxID=56036 RepID=A0AAD1YLK9_9LAMI|nr:unnamed protein product [Fraxinus pennsylvanica]